VKDAVTLQMALNMPHLSNFHYGCQLLCAEVNTCRKHCKRWL